MVKKIINFINSRYFFIFGAVGLLILLINNFYRFPVDAGYDAALHLRYAEIISRDWRLPELTETREGYNPPLFYAVSGTFIRWFGQIANENFFSAAKAWQFMGIPLVFFSLFCWHQIGNQLFKKNRLYSRIFLIFLVSFPVLHKTAVMYSLELWFFFLASLVLWFFVVKFTTFPNLKKVIILALMLVTIVLTRMNGLILFFVVLLGFFGLFILKRINWRQFLVYSTVTVLIVVSLTGWFYLGRIDKDIYGVGEGEKITTPFFQRQPLSFYTDVPFKLMMTYPIRQSVYINKLIPIYYNEVWGDYWNYFPQRRFGLTVAQVRQNRELTNKKRVANLAWQNQLNLLTTILIFSGFCYLLLRIYIKSGKPDKRWLIEAMFAVVTVLSWLGFLGLLTQFPSWKGDSIKASYTLYLLPFYAYFLTIFLLEKVSKVKFLFLPIVLWLSVSVVNNLIWSWF